MDLETSPLKNKIHLLPEHLIDQIKAGEVIERPASLIKEILENSIDAGSTQIDLHLVNCGLDLISIEDNGVGMSFEDLPYAFCRHATSKIDRFEDLYKLSSFGFRGEALASISSIARVTCTSSPKHAPEFGGKIIIHGGETMSHAEQPGVKQGTSLFIKDLFYNTPARLKFIKSQISEKNALKRMIQSFIISNPQITFSIKWDSEDKDFYPTTENFEKRISQIFHRSKNHYELFFFEEQYENHRIRGFLSKKSTKGNGNKRQFLFANNRYFTDKQIHQTIIRNCEGLYPQGEMGHYCIFIDVPPNLIDVNVHPNKTQIKFFKLPVITALISSEIKKLKKEHAAPGPEYVPMQDFNTPSSPTYSAPQSFAQFQETSLFPQATNQHTPQRSLVSKRQSSPVQILSLEEKNYLIHKKNLIEEFFYYLKEAHIKGQENDFIPLLISTPVSSTPVENEESLLTQLLELGVVVERLDSQSLVIRSFHKHYLDFDLESFIPLFMNNHGQVSFLQQTHFEVSEDWLCQIKAVLNFSSHSIVEINEENLHRIFSGS